MISLLSVFLILRNIAVKLWSIKPVRYIAIAAFTYYLVSNFYTTTMSRASSTTFTFPGWDALITIPEFQFNPSYIKSNKASFSIISSISMLVSVFVPGFLFVAIILFLQKVINTYKAPPLPIMYANEAADEVLVADYRMPVLYSKWEAEYEEEEEEEEDSLSEDETGGVANE